MIADLLFPRSVRFALITALFSVAGIAAWRAVAGVQSMVNAAAEMARAECDAHWREQLANANAKVALAETAQARAASVAESKIIAAEKGREDTLRKLEMWNAALADGGRQCLGSSRVRLLNQFR